MSCRRYDMRIKNFFRKKKKQLFVLRELIKKEKKHAQSETNFGQLWIVLDPLLHMAIFSFLATNWFKRDFENFPMYVLTGYNIYAFFSRATTGCITALVSNKSLLVQTKWKKEVFIEQRIYSAVVDFLYTCAAYLLFMVLFRIRPGIYSLLLIPDMLLMTILTYGAGKLLAVAYVFFADIRYFYDNFMILMMFASGIFYPEDILPDTVRWILEWNPVYLCIEIARDSVMYNRASGAYAWMRLLLWAATMFAAGNFVYSKKENAIMQKL